MPLHLIKLCVGADSIDDLASWQAQRLAAYKAAGMEPLLRHTTRQTPKRAAEILDGGSLYWVIRGAITCRQRVMDLRGFVDGDGIPRCDICLDPQIVRVETYPRGPFQGWRYYDPKDAPPDINALPEDLAGMPEELRRHMREMGIL